MGEDVHGCGDYGPQNQNNDQYHSAYYFCSLFHSNLLNDLTGRWIVKGNRGHYLLLIQQQANRNWQLAGYPEQWPLIPEQSCPHADRIPVLCLLR